MAEQTLSVNDLVLTIKKTINALADDECDPKPPGCDGSLGTGTYEGLAQLVQKANSSRRKLISELKKDFNTLAKQIGE